MEKIKVVNQGDILTFIAADGNYKVFLCTSTYKERSPHFFIFTALTYDNKKQPTIEDIEESSFFGIGNRKNSYFSYSDKELEQIWAVHPEIIPYQLGSYGFFIQRKNFMKFRENFKFICNFKILDNLDKNGNGSINSDDWNYLKEFFNEKLNTVMLDRGQKTFKIKSIIQK